MNCPRHDLPLELVADGEVNGQRIEWWENCPHIDPRWQRRCNEMVRHAPDAEPAHQPGLFGDD